MIKQESSVGNLVGTRKHFEILDGLRGVAAIAVVVFHFMEVAIPDYSKNFIGHGFLAVDFFFCLSGFVIAYAYDHRIAEIGTWEFFKARLIRLHPLVIFGSVLGIISFYVDPFNHYAANYSLGQIALNFITSILMIPYGVVTERFFNLFGLNAPAWSLFWEYVANTLYALVLYRFSKKLLMLCLVGAAVWLGYVGYKADALMGGWGTPNFWDGCARISYSFIAGMLVYRCNWIIKNKLGFVSMSVLLALAFLFPHFKYNWLAEVFVVLVYFPLMVALGAGAFLTDKMRSVCRFSGNLSYPLYMTHYSVIFMFLGYFTTYKPDTPLLTLIVVGGTLLLIAFAWLVMKVYDMPVRKYLARIWKRELVEEKLGR